MSNNYKKIADVYKSTERNALVESEDPHKLVLVMFDALIKSIEIYVENIDVKKADLELRSKHFSRALTIIYSLQSSLDFEKGGEVANNLDSLYAFSQKTMLQAVGKSAPENLNVVGTIIADLSSAWDEIKPLRR